MFSPENEMGNKIKINEKDFGKPVETIMKCGDFKSNFARRLSNRYVVKLGTEYDRESDLSKKVSRKPKELESMNEIIPAPASGGCRESGGGCGGCGDGALERLERALAARDIHRTELAALNTQVETLRWQLRQTEANRQMHIALLEQVVSVLHRVREHVGAPPPPPPPPPLAAASTSAAHSPARPPYHLSTKVLQSSFSRPDLPRSRSALHVNRGDFARANANKLTSKMMSKSISEVNGLHRPELATAKYTACKRSKLSLLEETNSKKMLVEELSRIIDLASTVLGTKLPHLSCVDSAASNPTECATIEPEASVDVTDCHQRQSDKQSSVQTDNNNTFQNNFTLNASNGWSNGFEGITNQYIEARDQSVEQHCMAPSPLTCGLENDFASNNLNYKCDEFSINSTIVAREPKKSAPLFTRRNEMKRDAVPMSIEDESGFSSMNSFQDIGIPHINIIPPTPCREINFQAEPIASLPSAEMWNAEVVNVDKQNMKVFWV